MYGCLVIVWYPPQTSLVKGYKHEKKNVKFHVFMTSFFVNDRLDTLIYIYFCIITSLNIIIFYFMLIETSHFLQKIWHKLQGLD